MQLLKITTQSDPATIVGAIAAIIHSDDQVELTAITTEAKSRTLDAIIAASTCLAGEGILLSWVPSSVELDLEGRKRTAVRFALAPHRASQRTSRDWLWAFLGWAFGALCLVSVFDGGWTRPLGQIFVRLNASSAAGLLVLAFVLIAGDRRARGQSRDPGNSEICDKVGETSCETLC